MVRPGSPIAPMHAYVDRSRRSRDSESVSDAIFGDGPGPLSFRRQLSKCRPSASITGSPHCAMSGGMALDRRTGLYIRDGRDRIRAPALSFLPAAVVSRGPDSRATSTTRPASSTIALRPPCRLPRTHLPSRASTPLYLCPPRRMRMASH